MNEINRPKKTTWWLAQSERGRVVGYGVCGTTQVVSTGQKILLAFDTQEALIAELKKLRVEPDLEKLELQKYQADSRDWVTIALSKRTALEKKIDDQIKESYGTRRAN